MLDLSFLPPCPESHEQRAAWLATTENLVQERFRSVRATSRVYAWARFLIFLLIPLGIYQYVSQNHWPGLALAGGGLVLFVSAVRRHGRVQFQAATYDALLKVIDETKQRLGGAPVILRGGQPPAESDRWKPLVAAGNDGLTHALSPQEIGDLDIFGEGLSVFGTINRTSSPMGAARLAHVLTHPMMDVSRIGIRQEATEWMLHHPADRMRLLAASHGLRPQAKECLSLYETIRDAEPLPRRRLVNALRVWGLAGPIALALGIANQAGWDTIYVGWSALAGVVIVNLVLLQFVLKEMKAGVKPWLHLDDVVTRLRFFAQTAADVLPNQGLLDEQRERLAAALAKDGLPALERRIPLLFLGLAGILHVIIDVLVFWDIQVLCLLERCYIGRRRELLGAIAATAECEMLASLGGFGWEQPVACLPQFSDECRLQIRSGMHPLIDPGEAVANELSLGGEARTWLITGSNMSGKSTFLRMTAVNVLLAMTGSRTTALGVRLCPLRIMTDLRIRDDLSRKESYFLAEVRQVKRMVEASRSSRPLLALIDEPFRGTNSAERIAAAWAVSNALIEGNGLHLIATHDASLTELGELAGVENKHFQEHFERDELVFDYTLRPGPAQSRNALRVLEAEGYPADVVDCAKDRYGRIASHTDPIRPKPSPETPPPQGGGSPPFDIDQSLRSILGSPLSVGHPPGTDA